MADNFTFKDAGGSTRTAKAADNSGVHTPATYLADSAGAEITGIGKNGDAAVTSNTAGTINGFLRGLVAWAYTRMPPGLGAKTKANSLSVTLSSDHDSVTVDTGASDDASAAGALFPLAGYRKDADDEVDDGDLGRVRMTARRALLQQPDTRQNHASGSDVSSAGDIEASTSQTSGYAAITTSDLNIRDTSNHYYRIPMNNWKSASINIFNSLGQLIDVEVQLWVTGRNLAQDTVIIYDETGVAASANRQFLPFAGGTGASTAVKAIAAMEAPCAYLILEVAAQSAPSSGDLRIGVSRR